MSLLGDVVPAFRAFDRRPSLLWVGLAVGVVQAGTGFAASAAAGVVGPAGGQLVAPFAVGVAALFTLPLYAGIYVPIARPPAGARETLAVAAGAVGRRYRRLLVANLLAAGVAVAFALVVGLLSLVVSTGARYARYALADPGVPYPMESVYLGMGSLFLGLWLGGLCVRFADVFVLFGDASPRHAWRSSLGFARLRPLSVLGFGATVTALHAAPALAGRFAAGFLGGGVAATVLQVGVTAALASVGIGLVGALQAVYFDRTVAPTVERTLETAAQSDGVRWARVGLAAAVLVAAVGGAVFVRTADVRSVDRERAALPDDPAAAYDVAATNTGRSNHRRVVLARNLSDPNATLSVHQRSAVDYRDRQSYVYFRRAESGQEFGSYFAEGTLAMRNSGGRASGLLAYQAGNWSVIAGPGYALASPGDIAESAIPAPDGVRWTVVDRNASTFVLRAEDPGTIRELLSPESYAGMGGNMTDDSYLTVFVDRDRGVVSRAVFRLHSRETGRNFRYAVRFSEVGTADLRRPEELGPRRPLEWAWDAVYY